jgi:uncharacterized protein (TIGR00299 family) protein
MIIANQVLWLDTTAGVAGDMVMAALVDAGAPLDQLRAAVAAVIPGSVRLTRADVARCGQRATKIDVETLVVDPPHRDWTMISKMIQDSDLSEITKRSALATFELLARAESRAHGIPIEMVHFHEVGALDSIADIVASCEALRLLNVTEIVGTPVAVGTGSVRTSHGRIPVPVPAVVQLALGWPTMAGSAEVDHGYDVGELATPTGMALVRALAARCGPQPEMVTTAVGVGAGTKDTPGRPNVVRVLLGTRSTASAPRGLTTTPKTVTELAANIDDLDPRLLPGVLSSLLDAGALDAWLTPALMKKGRPAHILHALCTPGTADRLTNLIFDRTSTLGVRRYARLDRSVRERAWFDLDLQGQLVRVKVGFHEGVISQATPEFEDVAAAASGLGISELEALKRAELAARQAGLAPGEPLPPGVANSSSSRTSDVLLYHVDVPWDHGDAAGPVFDVP